MDNGVDNKKKLMLVAAFCCEKYLASVLQNAAEESSDEEEWILATNFRFNKKKHTRMEFYLEKVVPNYSLQQFKEHFRMPKAAFAELLRLLGPGLSNESVGRPRVDVEKQLLAVIWLLATPDSFRSVGDRFDLSKSSLFHCFLRVINALNKIAPFVIKWPFVDAEREQIKIGFSKYGLNNVIGAIDGTYIQIKAPKYHPEAYICRKKFHSVTLQAICNDKLKFTDCFVGYPSSVHDVRIFRNSDIYRSIMNNPANYFPNDEYIIGDKAYPVKNWCITPYINRGGLNQRQIRFNKALSSTRQAIERAFALLKGRFRRLKYLEMSRIDLIPATILSCCVLHNICIENDDFDENYMVEGQENDVFFDENIDDVREDEAGTMRRDRIARNL